MDAASRLPSLDLATQLAALGAFAVEELLAGPLGSSDLDFLEEGRPWHLEEASEDSENESDDSSMIADEFEQALDSMMAKLSAMDCVLRDTPASPSPLLGPRLETPIAHRPPPASVAVDRVSSAAVPSPAAVTPGGERRSEGAARPPALVSPLPPTHFSRRYAALGTDSRRSSLDSPSAGSVLQPPTPSAAPTLGATRRRIGGGGLGSFRSSLAAAQDPPRAPQPRGIPTAPGAVSCGLPPISKVAAAGASSHAAASMRSLPPPPACPTLALRCLSATATRASPASPASPGTCPSPLGPSRAPPTPTPAPVTPGSRGVGPCGLESRDSDEGWILAVPLDEMPGEMLMEADVDELLDELDDSRDLIKMLGPQTPGMESAACCGVSPHSPPGYQAPPTPPPQALPRRTRSQVLDFGLEEVGAVWDLPSLSASPESPVLLGGASGGSGRSSGGGSGGGSGGDSSGGAMTVGGSGSGGGAAPAAGLPYFTEACAAAGGLCRNGEVAVAVRVGLGASKTAAESAALEWWEVEV
ncbi:hypothetical protein HYH03_013619 [Edaphochlamys debaryana]|uniref:Uncharacterized protein n=1 Tax=Edaphochlamys debaryana TaxID=47281 RepID=A0A835XY24_9CHLO|nr:hypothetical protein HYH03_013619 [Edaphochlamys debaryana]|eukprot:KAG2487774.1 hypothetical protein HYH03_013619 [Edaphochlamys debaryana]